MSEYGILVDGEVREVEYDEWSKWIKSDRDFQKRRIAHTNTENGEISTVFLGMDHSFGYGEPLWFETLVFGGSMDGEMERYTTLEQATMGHEDMVSRVEGDRL